MNTPYVIGLILSPTLTKYVAIDIASGGYPYWSESMSSACMFKTQAEAEKFLEQSYFTRTTTMADGVIHPPTMIHSGLGLCNAKESGSGTIVIFKLNLVSVFELAIASPLIVGYEEKPKLETSFIRKGF
jgi:hypothetical protein